MLCNHHLSNFDTLPRIHHQKYQTKTIPLNALHMNACTEKHQEGRPDIAQVLADAEGIQFAPSVFANATV
jgi:hypothetical protein